MVLKNIKNKILFFIGIFILLSFSVFAATPQFTFLSQNSGSKHDYNVNPGEEITDDYVITNIDNVRNIKIQLYLKDLGLKDGEKALPMEWVTILPSKEFNLEPGGKKDVSFVVEIPKDAETSTYKLGLRAKLIDYEGSSSGGAVTMSTAIGQTLLINVVSIETKEAGEVVYEEEVAESYNIFDKYRFILDGVFLILVILLIWRVYTLEKIVKGKKKRKK